MSPCRKTAASYCSSCGRKLGISRSIVLVDGPRPPLGVLILDDGSTIPVRVDLIVGRDPSGDELVQEGQAMAVQVADDSQSVSRSHLHLQLEEWDVLVADRGSSNGTFVWDEAANDWRRLREAERLRISGGTRLLMGRREVMFDQHHIR
jgi:pSer/pThr/pTyr-binding forkhead associated (FHA) protein